MPVARDSNVEGTAGNLLRFVYVLRGGYHHRSKAIRKIGPHFKTEAYNDSNDRKYKGKNLVRIILENHTQ